MNRQEIMELAHRTGCLDEQHYGTRWADRLLDFAEQVAATEREACAQVCEQWGAWNSVAQECAEAIRARVES